MRLRRRIALFLGPQPVRFLGMTVAGILLIGLTATTEHGSAAVAFGQAVRAAQSAAAGLDPGPSASESAAPEPVPTIPSPPPPPTASPRAGQIPVPPTTAPSPVPVTPAPSSPAAPVPTTAPPAATPSPSVPPRGGFVFPPSSAAPTPSPVPMPLAFRVDTGTTPFLFQLSQIVPGDTWTRDATVTNTGSVSFRYVFGLTQSTSSLLWTDPDGLFVRVTSGPTVLYDGPASVAGVISAPSTVAPGAGDVLRFTFSLPVTADNRLQGLAQDLQIVFTATQTP